MVVHAHFLPPLPVKISAQLGKEIDAVAATLNEKVDDMICDEMNVGNLPSFDQSDDAEDESAELFDEILKAMMRLRKTA